MARRGGTRKGIGVRGVWENDQCKDVWANRVVGMFVNVNGSCG